MPYTYHKSAPERHGSRHHAFLGVEEVDTNVGIECACGEKTVLAYALAPISERADEGETITEWSEREEVNPRCVAMAREELGNARPLMDVPGVDWPNAAMLISSGYRTVRHLKEATAQDLVEAGLPVGHAENIKSHLGTYEEYREEWEVLDQ